MFNRGSFSGANLQKFIGKQYPGLQVSEWYKNKDYKAIQEYIDDEADRFLKLYQFLIQRLPALWIEFAKEMKIIV
jgi:hypothetical protein